jgi:flagellar motor switch/type III secretory pathway protein FliN
MATQAPAQSVGSTSGLSDPSQHRPSVALSNGHPANRDPGSGHPGDQVPNAALGAVSTGSSANLPTHPATHSAAANSILVGGVPAFEQQLLRLSAPCARLPVALAVTVPVREFRVRNLLAMAPGAVIETQWAHGEDLPLSSGDVQLAWSEFEVVDTRLAVRVTRLA